jgi:hypothetical protein
MNTFPWSYGHNIAPKEWQRHLLHVVIPKYFSYGWFSVGSSPPYQLYLHDNQRPWPLPLPNMTIIPWSYGRALHQE